MVSSGENRKDNKKYLDVHLKIENSNSVLTSFIKTLIGTTRVYHTKGSQSEWKRRISYDITYMWNLKYDINESEKNESVTYSVMSNSLWPHGLCPARLLCPWNFPDKNKEWVAIFSPGNFPQPEIEPGSPALQADSLPSKSPGKQMNLSTKQKQIHRHRAQTCGCQGVESWGSNGVRDWG